MSENRELQYNDKWVYYLLQTLSDRFDTEPDFPELPFTDMTSRIPLVFRVNQIEYTQILSAIMTGADLAFPDIAHELELIWTYVNEFGATEDTCIDYVTSNSDIISYAPMNPFTEIGLVNDGYILPAWTRWDDILPDFIPDWLADLILDATGLFTGYEDNDILSLIGSIPLLANWEELLNEGLPRFTVTVEGKGHIELHLLNVPFGGRAVVTVDIEPNIPDILVGIFAGNIRLIELERDYSSLPPELDIDNIEEIEITTDGIHTIIVTMIPVVDIDAFPVKFGGGIRKITWCPDNIPDEPCPECPPTPIEEILADDEFFQAIYLPNNLGDWFEATQSNNTQLSLDYDGTPQSIGALIPVSAPDDEEDNALCYALNSFVKLYASSKVCIIQSRNFLEIGWDNLREAVNEVYNGVVNAIAFIYTPNLYSCFVDATEAITVLQDEAARSELACYLFDQLKSVTMTQANFDNAISSAATTLFGNEQLIACIMENDNNQTVYLNFLQSYNIALQRINAGEELPCDCLVGTYLIWTHDFAQGMGDWMVNYSGNNKLGVLEGGRLRGSLFSPHPRISIRIDDIPTTWQFRAGRLTGERVDGVTNGQNDFEQLALRPNINSTTGQTLYISGGFRPNGVFNRCGASAGITTVTGIRQIGVDVSTDQIDPDAMCYLDRIELQFLAPYGRGYKTEDSNMCI